MKFFPLLSALAASSSWTNVNPMRRQFIYDTSKPHCKTEEKRRKKMARESRKRNRRH